MRYTGLLQNRQSIPAWINIICPKMDIYNLSPSLIVSTIS
jgi:hypothetical protein